VRRSVAEVMAMTIEDLLRDLDPETRGHVMR
jgi:hypothetical protein